MHIQDMLMTKRDSEVLRLEVAGVRGALIRGTVLERVRREAATLAFPPVGGAHGSVHHLGVDRDPALVV